MAGAESRNTPVLNSWKEIASYLGRGVRTVQRWESEAGLPVHRPSGHSRSAVVALQDEIDEWLRSGGNPGTFESAQRTTRTAPSNRETMHDTMLLRERCIILRDQNKRLLDTLLFNLQQLTDSLEEARRVRLARYSERIPGIPAIHYGKPKALA